MWIGIGHGGTRNLFLCGSNEQDEDHKKKVFSSKISTNFGYCLKILAIFHKFLSEDQKKRGLSSKISINFGYRLKILAIFHEFLVKKKKKVNFFGAQSSFGGHNFRLGGTSSHLRGLGPGMPPVAPGLASIECFSKKQDNRFWINFLIILEKQVKIEICR